MPSEAINVDDIINQIRQQVPMSTLPSNGHTLLGTEVFDEAIGHINIRFEGDEQALSALDTAIKNVIKGDFIGVEGTNLLKWDKSDQGVKLNGSLLDTLEKQVNKDTANGYLGIDAQGKVHTGFLPFPTATSAGIVVPDEGIELGTNGHISVTPTTLGYTHANLEGVANVKGALDMLATVQAPPRYVYTSLAEVGYTEPEGAFDPNSFAEYCTGFTYGSKIVLQNVVEDTVHPKLAAFLKSAIGDISLFDVETVAATIENLKPSILTGAIKYTLINGSQTTSPQVIEEYTYIADDTTYGSRWEKTYSDDRTVCYYTANQMTEKLTWASDRDVGQTIVSYDDGNVYQLKRTTVEGTGVVTYSWEQKTISLPPNGTTYLGTQTDLTVSTGGNYVVFGNVTNLNIAATTPVTIHVLGIVTNLTLPQTEHTIILNASGYNGPDLTTESLVSLAAGSIIGKFHYGCIAL